MAMIDTYRNNIKRKKGELLKLSQDKTSESNKIKTQQQKIKSAKGTLSSTKSQSIIKSKINIIEKAESEIMKINDKVNELNKKITRKETEILDEEKKLRNEEAKEEKKARVEEKKRNELNNREMMNIKNTLTQHGQTQHDLQKAIIDLQKIPDKIKVLFMASNPTGSAPLRLDEEARAIHETIIKSKHRDSVEFVTRWAVRSSDVLQSINEVNPDVIHFSGHGTDTDKLVLQNTDGSPKLITKEAIVGTIATVSDKVRLVFFNTCFSFGQAENIVEHIEAAIGMTTSIGDEAARVFAAQFYSAIGFGLNLDKAFKQAKAALLLEGILEENTPELYVKDDLLAEDIYIVRPPEVANI